MTAGNVLMQAPYNRMSGNQTASLRNRKYIDGHFPFALKEPTLRKRIIYNAAKNVVGASVTREESFLPAVYN